MRLRFGDCVFDPDTREVLRGEQALVLSPKAFALLELLIERRPKVVSKEEIHARLWPDTFVSPANLANLVVELRSALDDDARHPHIIRTLPRFGYALRAEAAPALESPEPGREIGPLAYRLIWGHREIALDPGENLIGRDRAAAVWIDDESVSRRHANISIGNGGATIEDLNSKNGTQVGGRKIHRPTVLNDRDVVKVGPATMRLRVLRHTGSTRSTMTRDGSP